MPSFSQALSSILLTSALTTWPIITTTTAHPLFLSDGGHGKNQQRRVGKNSKKQNVVQQCTVEQFVGDYKYINCQGVETKVRIACDTKKGTKNSCDYQEAPLKNDDNTDDGCVVQGAFGATHIMKDPAKPGVCQLDFVALKNSCKAKALPSGFGMRAEVDITAGHADTSTSTLVLWFSNDKGVVYYNEDEPQEPVFLHQGFPRGRKLGGCDVIEPVSYAGPGTGTECTTDTMCKDKGHDCGRVGKKRGRTSGCTSAANTGTTALLVGLEEITAGSRWAGIAKKTKNASVDPTPPFQNGSGVDAASRKGKTRRNAANVISFHFAKNPVLMEFKIVQNNTCLIMEGLLARASITDGLLYIINHSINI